MSYYLIPAESPSFETEAELRAFVDDPSEKVQIDASLVVRGDALELQRPLVLVPVGGGPVTPPAAKERKARAPSDDTLRVLREYLGPGVEADSDTIGADTKLGLRRALRGLRVLEAAGEVAQRGKGSVAKWRSVPKADRAGSAS